MGNWSDASFYQDLSGASIERHEWHRCHTKRGLISLIIISIATDNVNVWQCIMKDFHGNISMVLLLVI